MNKNSEVYGAFRNITNFYIFLLRTGDPIIGWNYLYCYKRLKSFLFKILMVVLRQMYILQGFGNI